MTLDETRQMGIEFERRIQTIDPTTEIVAKIDTEDIYSYLNQYQLQYVKSLYLSDGQAESQSRPSNKIQDILKPLLLHAVLDNPSTHKTFDNYNTTFTLPDNYYSYIRSVSHITSSYKAENEDSYAPNIMLKQEDAQKVVESFYDKYRILRNPICTFKDEHTLEIIHDSYTTIDKVDLTYIKKPTEFRITGSEQVACDLPYDCFEDLVTGAVELYFNYKYKVSLASQAARRNATRAELGTGQQPKRQEAEE